MGAIRFEHIDKIYPGNVQAVFDFNLEIEDGEFIVFVGPSGCGKSTILRMLAGLEEISAGDLYIADKKVNNKAPVDRDISFVFQDYALYGNLTNYDNVGMSMIVRHADDVDIHDKVMETSEFLGITDYLKRVPGQLSGGQKQRVALGRAIAREPEAFLMDEPLSNLDAKLRTSTRAEIVKLQKNLGITTIYVTHDQVEAMTMADRIVVLKDGVIQQIGAPQDIYHYPANIFVGGFIGSPQMNFIRGKIQSGKFVSKEFTVELTEKQKEITKSYEGEDIIFGIRPESIVSATEEDKTNVLPLNVDIREYCGDYYTLHISIGSQELKSRVQSRGFSTEDVVNFHLKMEEAHFFDPGTSNVLK
ncbi:MAG: ABC transporter ATP-binding protein [Bacillota bacterium]